VSDELRAKDLDAVREQLGREPTVPFSVVARCAEGHPLVIRNRPLDAEGHPFPTIYWLTCPDAVKLVSTLEAEGGISQRNAELERDPELRAAVERSHAEYALERGAMLPGAEAWGGVGGTRTGLKCLHAHYAFYLAGGDDAVGRDVASAVDPRLHGGVPGDRVAAIDQGTNSTRLLILEPRATGEPLEIRKYAIITRLGKAFPTRRRAVRGGAVREARSGTARHDASDRRHVGGSRRGQSVGVSRARPRRQRR